MSEENKQATNGDSQNRLILPSATAEYVEETANDIPKPDSEATNDGQVNKEPIKVIVDQKEGWTITNKISLFGAIISLILAVFTYLLFKKTIEANQTSQSALQEAQKAVFEATRANDISEKNYALAQEAAKSGDIVNAKTIDLANQSLESQKKYTAITDSAFIVTRKYAARSDTNYLKSIDVASNSLSVIQKNFQIENRAIIFLAGFKADTIKAGIPIKMDFRFQNFGKSPTILSEIFKGAIVDTVHILSNDRFRYNANAYDFVNLFIPINGIYSFSINIPAVDQSMINLLIQKKKYLFVFGEIIYFDIVRKQNSSYQYCLRLYPTGSFDVTPNHNLIQEMYEVPKK